MGEKMADRRRISPRRIAAVGGAVILLAGAGTMAVLALVGRWPTEERARLKVAAEYVRASVEADYPALREVVADEAKRYVDAIAALPQPPGSTFTVREETWGSDGVTLEIAFGVGVTKLRLSTPDGASPGAIAVEAWNEASDDRAMGSITVADVGGVLVVTEIDGRPIDQALSTGSAGLW